MPTVHEKELVTFDVTPGEYRHWRLAVDGRVATLAMDVNEDCGLKPGYKLKLNSYDLGVDIELHDILQRILNVREPLYRKADATIDTGGCSVEESLQKLEQATL